MNNCKMKLGAHRNGMQEKTKLRQKAFNANDNNNNDTEGHAGIANVII